MTSNNTLGYWAAQEQYSMANLFEFVKEAERCGFTTAMTIIHGGMIMAMEILHGFG